ncbi:hypothetical protein NKH84_32610 [Mesorhizobium sp. M0902]|uniref:hypothetical protein n=1 Tax=Mesorhizobium sp. M0902 TaxID=2957021 RepID=UPI003337EBD5
MSFDKTFFSGSSGSLERPSTNFFELLREIGIVPVVNASAPKSNLSGPAIAEDLASVIGEAQKWSFDLAELNRRVGRYCAHALGARFGIVTGGSSAGILLALETAKILKPVVRPEVVIRRGDFGHYAYLFRQAGCELREVGNIVSCSSKELSASITEQTVAVAVVLSPRLPQSELTLSEVVEVAKQHGVPVLADCAAIFPSPERLQDIVSSGSDAIILSGGKVLGGPQASGLLIGDKRFVNACHQVSFPNDGPLRAVKIDRGQMLGIAAAVRKFTQLSTDALREEFQKRCEYGLTVLNDLPCASVTILPEIMIEGLPMIAIADKGELGHRFFGQLADRLSDGPIPIGVHYIKARRLICISPIGLSDQAMKEICKIIREEWIEMIDGRSP